MTRSTLPLTVLLLAAAAPVLAQEIPAVDRAALARAAGPNPTNPDAIPASAVPRGMPPEIPTLSPQRALTAKEKAALAPAADWRRRPGSPREGADGRVYFPYGVAESVVVCAPLRLCTIVLEAGENLSSQPLIGDPRWTVTPGRNGDGPSAQTTITVKPSDAGLDTNLLLQTDRGRSYPIRLVSRTKDYMPLVAFDYPADAANQAWQAYAQTVAAERTAVATDPCDQSPSVPPSAYAIDGKNVPWKPVQVYAVATGSGEKTCVQFGADIASHDLPALLELGSDGGWFSDPSLPIVDAQFSRGRYTVHKRLDNFVLVSGVGSNQQRVTVRRQGR